MITKLIFAMLLLKLSTLSAAIFLFVSLVVAFMREVNRSFSSAITFFFFQYSLSDVDIRH